MNCTLKVRDRTTNKIREAQIDQEDFERLKGYNYLIDKNAKEPFREVTLDGKRPRIALKRDIMNFSLGDPRRVCYVDKKNIFDCRKVNLKTKADKEEAKVVKMVKKVTTKVAAPVEVEEIKPVAATPITAPEATVSQLPVACDCNLEAKRTLLAQIDPAKLVELISLETLLAAWAETHGYKKQA